jgi:Kef-type K+ transport system membrane component KefB
LIAGLILGPSLFGLLLPDLRHALFPKTPEQKAMIDAISQFGILLLLLLTGMETDLKLVRQTGRASLFASLMGIVIPFVCGFVLGEMLPDGMLPDPQKRLITSLFLGTALSIASVKIVAMVVREMNFVRRVVGQVILASAIIDDSIGWIIVSIIFSLALHGSIEPIPLAQSIVGTVLFMVASLTIGRRLVFFVIRWVNDYFVSEFAVITAILVVMGIMALITHMIGVHTVLGAFVAGILVGESPILTRHIDEQLRGLITAFFAPVFFGIAGLSADLTVLADPEIALFTAGLVLVASLGKFGGAFLGAELGGLTRREGFALACGMNARGSTEVIIATVGLSIGALNQNLFTMIVAMAVLTTRPCRPRCDGLSAASRCARRKSSGLSGRSSSKGASCRTSKRWTTARMASSPCARPVSLRARTGCRRPCCTSRTRARSRARCRNIRRTWRQALRNRRKKHRIKRDPMAGRTAKKPTRSMRKRRRRKKRRKTLPMLSCPDQG